MNSEQCVCVLIPTLITLSAYGPSFTADRGKSVTQYLCLWTTLQYDVSIRMCLHVRENANELCMCVSTVL